MAASCGGGNQRYRLVQIPVFYFCRIRFFCCRLRYRYAGSVFRQNAAGMSVVVRSAYCVRLPAQRVPAVPGNKKRFI